MSTNNANTPAPEQRKPKRKRTPLELLEDPTLVTVTVSQAAAILGIAKSTAHKNYHDTGYLLNGNRIPVLVCGSRTIVSIEHLRNALGFPTPIAEDHAREVERLAAVRAE